MPIYRPSELHQFLTSLGVSPKKRLSQNFLIDGNIIRKIVAAAEIQPNDLVIEIGPGPGCLSEEVLEKKARLKVVEKDHVMAEALLRIKKEDSDLEIFCDDIMQFPLEETLKNNLKPGEKAIIIGNLPYHLTTPILAKLIPLRDYVSRVVVMVQEEVARRFTAKPSTPEYGSFTVFLNYYSKPRYAFSVGRKCFYPAPNVDSGVVTLDLKEPPKVSSEENFFVLTRTAFGQRRKMLRASLKELYGSDKVTEALKLTGQDVLARPETLSLEDFIKLFEALNTL